MNKDYSSIDSRDLTDSFDIVPEVMDDHDRRIRSRIDLLREKGYSEDDILLLLLEDGCRPKIDNHDDIYNQRVKSKRFTYTSDIHKK